MPKPFDKTIPLFLCILMASASTKAQSPLTTGELPYWMEAIDRKDADYTKALESFEMYWKDHELPEEEENTAIEADHHSDEDEDTRLSQATSYALLFQVRRFRKWALLHRPLVREDGSLRPDAHWLKSDPAAPASDRSVITAQWMPTGPNSSLMYPSPPTSRSGRMCQLKFDPQHPEKLYAISGSGGLFISEDHGAHWHSTGTDALPFTYQPASICIDHTDDRILYLGMGDANFGSQGHGVWKSTDGGLTWFDSSGDMGDRLVFEIIMQASDHQVLIAATDNGIWKSTDAGTTWQLKQAITGDAFLDLKSKPNADDILFACTFSKYYRSVDGGDTWTRITDGLTIPAGGGSGMRLALSDANPDVVYLGMLAKHGTVFKSTDGGTSFQLVYQDTVTQSLVTYTQQVNGGSNGNYNFAMAADPLNADVVYFGTQTLWKSTDGGAHWTSLYPYLYIVHPDIHDLKFSPVHHGLFNLNDGGIALSMDDGHTWMQMNDDIVTAEIYTGGQSPIRQDMMIIGTQDNGALSYHGGQWYPGVEGDVSDRFWFDYHTPDRYYSDRGESHGLESIKDYHIHFPLTVYGNRKMLFSPIDSNVAFVCQNEVWRTTNLLDAVPQWTQITLPLSASSSDFIRDMVISPADPNELYVVYGNSKILVSHNALASVPDFDTLTAPASTLYAQSCMAVSAHDPHILYLAAWNQIFRSDDQGQHWTDITENLPDANIDKIVHDGYSHDESIYVLCDNQVYYRNDSLMAWVNYSQGLPRLSYIGDLLIYNDGSRKSLLRTISYGRGVFETPLYRPAPLPYADFTVDTTSICTREPVHFTDLSVDGTEWRWRFDGGIPASFEGRFPPPVIYETPGTYAVALEVSNANGSDVLTKERFIDVAYQFSLPYAEGFEGAFPPAHMAIPSLTLSNIRWRQAQLGGYDESQNCAIFDDSYTMAMADMQVNINLSGRESSRLYFDVAYARHSGNVIFDSLAILVSADCGQSLDTVYKKGGTQLSTMPDLDNILSFNPGAEGWRTDTVDISLLDGHENSFIYFRGFGHAGELIAVDNIRVDGLAVGTAPEPFSSNGFKVIPNPADGVICIRGAVEESGFVIISNALGEVVFRQAITGDGVPFVLNTEQLMAGIYFVALTSGARVYTETVVVR